MASALGIVAVVLCLSLLDGLWTWLVAAAIAEVAGQKAPPLLVVGLVAFGAWVVARSLAVADVSVTRRRQVLAFSGLGLALGAGTVQSGLALPTQLVFGKFEPDLRGAGITLLLVVTYLWGRGLALAGPLSRERVLHHIGVAAAGLAVVLVFLPLSTIVREEGMTEVLASFLVGLAALLLVQLHGVESKKLSPWQWMGVGLGGAMLLVVGGAIVTGTFSSGGLSLMAQGIAAVGRLVAPFTNVVLLAAGYLAQYLFYLVQWLATVFRADPELVRTAVQNAENARPEFENNVSDAPEVLAGMVAVFVTLLFVAIAVLIYYRLVHRAATENAPEVTEERFREAGPGWRGLLRGALDRFGRGAGDGEEADRRLAVRRRYRDFQTLMARAGTYRLASETASEFEHTTRAVVPGAAEPLAVLTTGYVAARYASAAAPLPDLAVLDGALDQIRDALGRPASAEHGPSAKVAASASLDVARPG